MKARLSTRDYEQISAYLDGQLPAGERARFETRINADADLRKAMEEMGRTRALLRMAPHRRAPRNFTLTRAMIPVRAESKRFSWGFFPALSFASALATLVLIATIFLQQSPMMSAQPNFASSDSSLPQNAAPLQGVQAAPSAGRGATSAAANPEPTANVAGSQAKSQPNTGGAPVITWGGGPATGMGGGSADGIGGAPLGMGGGPSSAGNGPLVVPPEGIETLPTQLPTQATADTPPMLSAAPSTVNDTAPITGTGPILGVPQDAQTGKYLEPLPTFIPTPTPSKSTLPASTLMPTQPEAATLIVTPEGVSGSAKEDGVDRSATPLLIAQITLALVALMTGAAAFLAWRRGRRMPF